jgi:hypothetical protein
MRAQWFKTHKYAIEDLYLQARMEDHLTEINKIFLRAICDLLGIKTQIDSRVSAG